MELTALPKRSIFISYARDDDEPFAKQLYEDLTGRGISVWWDQQAMQSRGRTFLQELRDAIEGAERVLFIIGPNAVKSRYCRVELEHALLFAKGVVPILRQGDYSLVPKELSNLDCVDFRIARPYPDALSELLRKLETPVAPLGPLRNFVPAPPPHFVPRQQERALLSDAVLADVKRPTVITSARQVVGVQGMGGVGKSVLAAAFARANETRRAFPDGIVWVKVGQRPDLFSIIQQIGLSFDENPAQYLSIETARAALPVLLEKKCCLVVMDDVWEIAAVALVKDAIGPLSRLLFTTRDASVVARLGAQLQRVDVLTNPVALTLLAEWSDQPVDSLPPEAVQVASECGNLPLALAMIGATVRGRPDRWKGALQRLQRADLDRIRQEFPNYPYTDLLRAFEVSIEALDLNNAVERMTRERYSDLAVFPEGIAIPEAAFKVLWEPMGLDELDTQEVIDVLVGRSLAQRDGQGRVRLHDLQSDYVKRKAGDLRPLHARLLAGYAAPRYCPLGWASGPDDGYFFQHLLYHLDAARQADVVQKLLLDFAWLKAKLQATDIYALLTDFDHPADAADIRAVHRALQLSAHALAFDKNQLVSQLHARVASRHAELHRRLEDWAWSSEVPWIRAVRSSLSTTDSPELRTLVGHTNSVMTVAMTSNERYVVSGAVDFTLRVWDLETGLHLRTLHGHEHVVSAVAVTQDCQRIVSGSWDGTVRLWDFDTGECLRIFQGHAGEVSAVVVTPQGHRAISASWDGTLRVWDLEAGRELRTLRGHVGGVYAVAMIPDAHLVISAGEDQTVRIWDLEQGRELRVLKGHRSRVNALATTLDGRRAVSGSADNMLKVWDVETGRELFNLKGHTDKVEAVAVTTDGRVVSGAQDNTLKMWNLGTGEELCTLDVQKSLVCIDVKRNRAVGAGGFELKVWALEVPWQRRSVPRHADALRSIAITSDGRRAVSCSNDRTLKVWEVETGLELNTLHEHAAEVVSVAVTADAQRLVSGAWDGTLKVWDLETGKTLRTLSGHKGGVHAVAITPDSRFVISSGSDQAVRVWDPRRCRALRGKIRGVGEVFALAVTPDGKRLVMASDDRTLRLWDMRTSRELSILEGCTQPVDSIAVTPDGDRVVCASRDGMVRVWNLNDGRLLRTLDHSGIVFGVALMSNGSRVVSVSLDGRVTVWELESGATIASFNTDDSLLCCAVGPDGVTVLAGGFGGVLQVLRLENPPMEKHGASRRPDPVSSGGP